jgi:hypothetical protein
VAKLFSETAKKEAATMRQALNRAWQKLIAETPFILELDTTLFFAYFLCTYAQQPFLETKDMSLIWLFLACIFYVLSREPNTKTERGIIV